MKKLTNILRGSQITPFERVKLLVHNDIYKEKTGKDTLSKSSFFTLTEGWNPRNNLEAKEYNKYINIARLDASMKIDTKVFSSQSEVILLRNQRLLEYFTSNNIIFKRLEDQEFLKDISEEESLKFLTQSTYLEYSKVLHIFTFDHLSKEIQNDLLLLNRCVNNEKKYMEEQVFLYELFKNGDKLSEQDKDLIVDSLYSCMYYERSKKIKNSTAEKDGFLLHCSFADLSVRDLFQKLISDAHITTDNGQEKISDENLLLAVEKYAESKNVSIKFLIKDKLSQWLDDGLFLKDYPLLFKTKDKEFFISWYTELQKSKQYFQNLFDTGKLIKQNIEISFLGMPKSIEIITGGSLLSCNENLLFVKEYKQQIKVLLPTSSMFLFLKNNTDPIKSYRTLCEIKKISQKISTIFDIDMSEKYTEFVDSYYEEITFFNRSLVGFVDMATEDIYMDESIKYVIDIIESNFSFNLDLDDGVAKIAELYYTELEKIVF